MNANNVAKMELDKSGKGATQRRMNSIEPLVDIFETDEALTLVADLPGVQEQHLEITIDKDILTIDGRGADAPEGRNCAQEFSHGHYHRQFRLTDAVDSDKVSAELARGVLTLIMPKAETALPRRVEVTTVH